MELSGLKKKKDSKGILGGLAALIGFGFAAKKLSQATGVEVSREEIETIVDQGKFIAAQSAVWIALAGTLVGLWGNWVRKYRVAFLPQDGEKPALASRGVWGNLAAFGAGAFAFVEAIGMDGDSLRVLIGDAKDNWQIVAPSVLGIYGAVLGFWGRYRADRPVKRSPAAVSAYNGFVIPFVLLVLCVPACATQTQQEREMEEAMQGVFGPAQKKTIAESAQWMLDQIKFDGRIESGRLWGSATLFGFGPEMGFGVLTPKRDLPAPYVNERQAAMEVAVARLQTDFALMNAPDL